jgi:type IV pilus assembly protein PilZ
LAGDEDVDWGPGAEEMPKRVKDRRRSITPVAVDARRGGTDRRVHERVLVDIEVDYKADETFLFAYITDISAMGIFVRTIEPLPVGTQLTLRFAPEASREPFVLTGTVEWVNAVRPLHDNPNPGMGISFRDLTLPDRERIVEVIHTIAYLRDNPEKPRGKAAN